MTAFVGMCEYHTAGCERALDLLHAMQLQQLPLLELN